MIPTPIVVDVNAPGLSDDERHVVSALSDRLERTREALQESDDYYCGEQGISHLGIAIPEQLEALEAATGWPRVAVDALEERLDIQGFRFPTSVDADADMWDIWTANLMEQESQLAILDSLVFGRAFAAVGTGEDVPLITVESPMNMAADFDARTRRVADALQVYEMDGEERAALYRVGVTIQLRRPKNGTWEIVDRDEHGLPRSLVTMIANRPRTHYRYGSSEITPEIMAITDAACRTLVGMEVSREFYGAPQRYALGVAEGQFVKPDGTPTSSWETTIGRLLAIERDEGGEVPTVGQFASSDPSAFTNLMLMYARLIAAVTGLPQHLLGFAADNPASAEGIRSAEARLDRRARRKQRPLGAAFREVMKDALTVANGGELPADAHKIDVLWADVATPTPAATTQAILQQVQMGYLPADSDITGERLGYSAVERERIRAERARTTGLDALHQIASSLSGNGGA